MKRGTVMAMLALVLAGACSPAPVPARSGAGRDAGVLALRATRLEEARNRPAADGDGPLARWLLPSALSEISGLALDDDDRLFAHDDEHGRIFEIDYRRGVVVKDFRLGPPAVRGDFEGLTIAGDMFYLLSSDGRILRFSEGADGSRVPFTEIDTRLGRECEFEGIAYDRTIDALLLACKQVGIAGLENHVVIYRWSLVGAPLPRIAIPLAEAIGANAWREIAPSDLTIDPADGHYVLIASRQSALLDITPAGAVLRSGQLPDNPGMTEGVAITRDRLLIIASEASVGAASIQVFRRP